MIKVSIAAINCFQMCGKVTVHKAHYPTIDSHSQTNCSLVGLEVADLIIQISKVRIINPLELVH